MSQIDRRTADSGLDSEIDALSKLVLTALSRHPASLRLENCQLVNVHTGEIYPTDICIQGDRIASISASAASTAEETIDCQGLYAVPGLIDPHMHVDTTFLGPGELTRVLVPLGTTTVFVDTTNIAHTGGVEAVRALMQAFDGIPLRSYFSVPSYCPLDPVLETAAADLNLDDIATMLSWPRVVSMGETVSSKIFNEDEDYLGRIAQCLAQNARVSGHGENLSPEREALFDAYVTAGISDDHNSADGPGVTPRLRRGLTLFAVEAPGRNGQLKRILGHVLTNDLPTRHICLCVDNITVMHMVAGRFGYLDRLVGLARELGVSQVDAIRMATLNPAAHYRMSHLLGNLAPGRFADILLMRAPDQFPPEIVIAGGRVVARDGEMTVDIPKPNFPRSYRETIRLHASASAGRLALKAVGHDESVQARVIRATDSKATNTCFTATLEVAEGDVQPDIAHDILKIVMVERYGRNGNIGVGFVQGFGLERGAIASSVSIPSNNLVAVGTSDEELWYAVQHLVEIQGGFVVMANGRVEAEVRLPLGGLMAEDPFEDVVTGIENATRAAQALGCKLQHPFFTMAQTVLSTLPDLGLTDRGLVDARRPEIVPVIVSTDFEAGSKSRDQQHG